MAIERTEIGTVTETTSGTTLTLSNVNIKVNSGIVVAVAYDQTQGLPTIKWGGATLTRMRSTSSTISGLGIAVFIKPQIRNDRTVDIVATWSGAIGARVMIVTEVRGATIEDVGRNREFDTPTTTVNSGFHGLPNFDNAFAAAYWVGAVDVENFAGDIATFPAYQYLDGQLAGTGGGSPPVGTGSPPFSGSPPSPLNITMKEGYFDMETAIDTRARLLNATPTFWVCVVVIMRQNTMFRQGITPSDDILTDAKFALLELDNFDKVYAFNEALDRWEVFDVARASLPSPIANNENGWS